VFDKLPELKPPGVPLAFCAILYSFEGINLILPVESAMQEPKEFECVFVKAALSVMLILIAFRSFVS
jgi:proton-coupled amino acid transporter